MRKTVLRSFRLEKEVDEILQKESQSRGISVNALVSQILKKFVEWDRYVERFGFVTIMRDGFRILHEELKEEEIERLARDIGGRNPREAMLFWFKSANTENLLKWLSLHCKYGRIAECEIQRLGNCYIITLHHFLGKKYSLFLANWLDEAFRSVGEPSSSFEVNRDSVVFTLETKKPA